MLHKNISLVLALSLALCTCKKETKLDQKAGPFDFLSAEKYPALIVDIQYMNGFQPEAATISHLKAFLEARLNKPQGVSFSISAIPAQGKASYSLEDIKEMESKYRMHHTAGVNIVAFYLFLDGGYTSDGGSLKTLGVAYDNTSMAIFEKTVVDYSGGLGEPSQTVLESTVMEHEFGHLLGLVNSGTAMRSSHEGYTHHCDESSCLMFHTVETTDVIANLLNGVPELEQQCIDDLRGNGGK